MLSPHSNITATKTAHVRNPPSCPRIFWGLGGENIIQARQMLYFWVTSQPLDIYLWPWFCSVPFSFNPHTNKTLHLFLVQTTSQVLKLISFVFISKNIGLVWTLMISFSLKCFHNPCLRFGQRPFLVCPAAEVNPCGYAGCSVIPWPFGFPKQMMLRSWSAMEFPLCLWNF